MGNDDKPTNDEGVIVIEDGAKVFDLCTELNVDIGFTASWELVLSADFISSSARTFKELSGLVLISAKVGTSGFSSRVSANCVVHNETELQFSAWIILDIATLLLFLGICGRWFGIA